MKMIPSLPLIVMYIVLTLIVSSYLRILLILTGVLKTRKSEHRIGTFTENQRNAIGSHSGSYTIYRALSIAASGHFSKDHKPDLHNTNPTDNIWPHPSWTESEKLFR